MKKLAIILLCGAFGMAKAQTPTLLNQADNLCTSGGLNAGTTKDQRDNTFYGFQAGMYKNFQFGNTLIGSNSGMKLEGSDNVLIGKNSGLNSLGIHQNIFVGNESGFSFDTGNNNIFLGYSAGNNRYSCQDNIFIGKNAGSGEKNNYNENSINNIFLGNDSGRMSYGQNNIFVGRSSGYNCSGINNVFIGDGAGGDNMNGNSNVIIGINAGFDGNGSRNIFIGNQAGNEELGSDKLFIDNSSTSTPLIWGDFESDQLKLNGKVGVGGVSAFPTTAGSVDVRNYNLFVNGGILTEEVRVALGTTWADYIFELAYRLPTLAEVETHIKEKGHLINVPSAAEVKSNGIEVGEMAKIQMAKIEELTLYIIEQNKINDAQSKKIADLEAKIEVLISK